MKRLAITCGIVFFVAIPHLLTAQSMPDLSSHHTLNHGEVSAYGDLYRVSPSNRSATNFVGIGARAGFNIGAYTALEGEMNYDFQKNYTDITLNNGTGVTSSTTYTADVRPVTALFGPKFQLGTSGPIRAFVQGKAGFIQFTTNCNAPAGSPSCFTNSLAEFGGNSTHFAVFPGGGIEVFAGPLGLRAEAGDEVWVNNGAHNNLRITFGPTFRF